MAERDIILQPTDLLSLERMLFELRIPNDTLDQSETDAINDIIKDATDAVITDTNIPILPENASLVVENSYSYRTLKYTKDPYALNFLKTGHPIRFPTTENNRDADIFDGVLNDFEITNETINDTDKIGILSGYSDTGFNGYFQIIYRRGLLTENNKIGDLRSMVILRARGIFDGVVSVPEKKRSAYERLLERTRFEGLLPLGFSSLGRV